jgi:hypothetical protein
MPKTSTPVLDPEYFSKIHEMPLPQVAALVRRACRYAQLDAEGDGRRPPGWSIHAFPYAEALATVDDIRDMYYSDSAVYLLAYLLNNLQGWRGPLAKLCKARLKALYAEGDDPQQQGKTLTGYNQRVSQA